MGLLDTVRAGVSRGRKKLDDLGLRLYTVTLIVEQFDRSINLPGCVLIVPGPDDPPNPIELQLDPRPRVRQLGPGDDSWLGGGLIAEAGGKSSATEYEIGPVTLEFSGSSTGGYSTADLLPPGSVSRRVTWWIEGPDLQDGGEPFSVVQYRNVSLTSVMIRVQRDEKR
jgi:hypothetical protein